MIKNKIIRILLNCDEVKTMDLEGFKNKGRIEMQLRLKNIGKISKANIELNGITVIAGENDTGKSTVGKVLFSMFNSFSNLDVAIKATRINSLARAINNEFANINDTCTVEDFKKYLESITT